MNPTSINFPVQFLPERLREALREASENLKAPIPMLASAMLAAASSATQGLVNVRRPNGMVGPVSLLFITVAESGERKTACDEVFTRAIREFEARQLADESATSDAFKAEHFIWNEKLTIIQKAISKLLGEGATPIAEDGAEIHSYQAQLESHLKSRPERPRLLQILLQDSTPEGIMSRVQKHCPLLFLNCDEGGKVLNSNLAHSLTLLNSMRDGSAQYHDRKTSDRQIVPFVRLSSHIQAQPKTLQRFFEKQGSLARDNGFIARNWVTYPPSTQGFRSFNGHSLEWPKVDEFNRRVTELLEETRKLHENKNADLQTIEFCEDAAWEWVKFYNYIESHQQPSCIYNGIRDAASKTAETVARLAVVLHKFEGKAGPVSFQTIKSACEIGIWYLDSFRMIFDPPEIPQHIRDAQSLEGWMLRRYQQTGEISFKKNFVLQHGPLRRRADLDSALHTLIISGRVSRWIQNRTSYVSLTPAPMPMPMPM